MSRGNEDNRHQKRITHINAEETFMRILRVASVMLLGLLIVSCAGAGGQALTVETAHGTVDKAEKDSLSFQPRTATGQLGKKMTLKVTATSKVTAVALEKRAGKLVPVQREIDVKDLESGQKISIIYAGGSEPILLAAVVQREVGAKK
jgi:hypothetical protein